MISCNLLLIKPVKMNAQLKGRMEAKNNETCACNYSLAYVWKWLKLQMGRMSQGGADNSRNELSGVSLCLFSRPQTEKWNISDHIFQTLDIHHCLLRWDLGGVSCGNELSIQLNAALNNKTLNLMIRRQETARSLERAISDLCSLHN